MLVQKRYDYSLSLNGFKPLFATHAKGLLVNSKGQMIIKGANKVPLPVLAFNEKWEGPEGETYDMYVDLVDGNLPGPSSVVTNILENTQKVVYAFKPDNDAIQTIGTETTSYNNSALSKRQTTGYQQQDDITLSEISFENYFTNDFNTSYWTYALLKLCHEATKAAPQDYRTEKVDAIDPMTGSINLAQRQGPHTFSQSTGDISLSINLKYQDNLSYHTVLNHQPITYPRDHLFYGSGRVSLLHSTQTTGMFVGFNGRDGGSITFLITGTIKSPRDFSYDGDTISTIFGSASVLLEVWKCANHSSETLTDDDSSNVAIVSPAFEKIDIIELGRFSDNTYSTPETIDISGQRITLHANMLYYFRLAIVATRSETKTEGFSGSDDAVLFSQSLDDYASITEGSYCQISTTADLTLKPIDPLE